MAASVEQAPFALPGLTPSGRYDTKQQLVVTEVTGAPALGLGVVPTVLVVRAMSDLRKTPPPTFTEAIAVIEAGLDLFANGTVDGMPADLYKRIVCEVTGSPITVVERAVAGIVTAGRSIEETVRAARPAGVSWDRADPEFLSGSATWVRRGQVLAVLAAGNSPTIHASWLPALALGFRIAVRPSRREPLTAYRLVSALRQAGLEPGLATVLATDYAGADELLGAADLAIVFGGADVASKYAVNRNIAVNGPGRSKLLITADVDWRDHLDVITESISANGGANCVNATAVLVEGDTGDIAQAVAERLADLPTLPPYRPDAVLPVRSLAEAQQLERQVLDLAQGSLVRLGADGITADLGDGSAALRPAVFELATATDTRIGMEFPFPCVWIARWSRDQGLEPLRHSLALTALTRDEQLVAALLDEPSIASLKVGPISTSLSAPHLPHDDYLLSFLMRANALHRAWPVASKA